MKNYLIIFFSLILLSCTEEITLDLPQAASKLVVEGYIEPGFPPYVILTRNEGYFDPIDSNTFTNLFITDAIVKVWTYNGEEKDSIMLECLRLPPPLDSISIYTDTVVGWLGEIGKTYYLEIKWNNQTITAQTFIPEPTKLDCLWVEQSETAADSTYKCEIRAVYSDPADQQNNILIKSKRVEHYTFNEDKCKTSDNSPDFLLKLVDAGSDILINGESFETYFPRPRDNGERGFPNGKYNASRTRECADSTFEIKEDIVLIKFCQIDESSMKFWRGLVRQAGTNGNPFSEPANLVSNINGGLGVWTGYSPVYYLVPIVKNTTIDGEFPYIPTIFDIF
jgi:hypothetical protein